MATIRYDGRWWRGLARVGARRCPGIRAAVKVRAGARRPVARTLAILVGRRGLRTGCRGAVARFVAGRALDPLLSAARRGGLEKCTGPRTEGRVPVKSTPIGTLKLVTSENDSATRDAVRTSRPLGKSLGAEIVASSRSCLAFSTRFVALAWISRAPK